MRGSSHRPAPSLTDLTMLTGGACRISDVLHTSLNSSRIPTADCVLKML